MLLPLFKGYNNCKLCSQIFCDCNLIHLHHLFLPLYLLQGKTIAIVAMFSFVTPKGRANFESILKPKNLILI